MTRIRRSVLFMPGDSLKKITKATQLDVDSIVMDLEDGVAWNKKAEARHIVAQACQSLDFGYREKLIRINPISSNEWQTDLETTVVSPPHGYVIPKVESSQDLVLICEYLTQVEKKQGWPLHGIQLLALIETARGVFHLPEIVQTTPRLSALMFGSEDLAGNMGAIRTPESWEVFYAKSAVVLAAAAYQLDALDTIYPNFQDTSGLEKEATQARQMGYRGKMAIHPNQLTTIHRAFSPSLEEIDSAQQLLETYEKHQAQGTGAFAYQGKMIDMPMIRSAQKIIDLAKALQRT